MEYELIVSRRISYFNNFINERLQEGWKLYGYSTTILNNRGILTYSQAVIKEKIK